MTLDGDMSSIKIVVLEKIQKFVVKSFLILDCSRVILLQITVGCGGRGPNMQGGRFWVWILVATLVQN